MQYLIRWRISLAAQQLLSGNRGVAQIAQEVGYESEAAFNRAFKRELGVPPATWRKTGGAATSGGASSLLGPSPSAA
jgi:AraC-like DNA-binding protein